MIKAIIFAGIASIGNALFVFGQRGVEPSKNPFLVTCGAVLVCNLMFISAALYCHTDSDISFLLRNYSKILISGLGFFITFFGFYLLYSRFGASHYIIYAVLSILTTSIGVGVLYYKEPFNLFHAGAMLLAILSIVLYSYGQYKAHP